MCSDLFANYNKQFAPQVEQMEMEHWGCMVVPILVEGLVSLRRLEYPRNNQSHTAGSSYQLERKDLIRVFLNNHTPLG
jgi:hypothetical protein